LSGAVSLDVGEEHSCAVLYDGRLTCWGQNQGGSCGQPLRTRYLPKPQFVPKIKDVAAVSAGVMVTCDLDHAGLVACFGNSFVDDSMHPVPKNVALPGKATSVVAGGQHACAILEDGSVVCWGDNDRGQLGDGTRTKRATAAPVKGLGKATRIALSAAKTCALVEGGRVFCWGESATQLASTGMSDDSAVPLEIALPLFPD
jgi:alpha-tubulin suppressor-like RCC1 family protein